MAIMTTPELLWQLKGLRENNSPAESFGDHAEQSTSEAEPGIGGSWRPNKALLRDLLLHRRPLCRSKHPVLRPLSTCVHPLRKLVEFSLPSAVLTLLIWPLPCKNRSAATGAAPGDPCFSGILPPRRGQCCATDSGIACPARWSGDRTGWSRPARHAHEPGRRTWF